MHISRIPGMTYPEFVEYSKWDGGEYDLPSISEIDGRVVINQWVPRGFTVSCNADDPNSPLYRVCTRNPVGAARTATCFAAAGVLVLEGIYVVTRKCADMEILMAAGWIKEEEFLLPTRKKMYIYTDQEGGILYGGRLSLPDVNGAPGQWSEPGGIEGYDAFESFEGCHTLVAAELVLANQHPEDNQKLLWEAEGRGGSYDHDNHTKFSESLRGLAISYESIRLIRRVDPCELAS